MADLNNCILPDDLLYSTEDNVWVRDLGDGRVELGMTDIAQTMAGSIIHCRPKKAGSTVKKGKSVATVESGKWVGPVKSPFSGTIDERNDAVEADATLINRSPYRDGWIVRIQAENLAAEMADMVQGDAAVEKFKAYMEAHELPACIHCEGFEE